MLFPFEMLDIPQDFTKEFLINVVGTEFQKGFPSRMNKFTGYFK